MAAVNCILSKVRALSLLRLNPIPARPFAAVKATRHGNVTVLVGPNGKVYSSEVKTWTYWTSVDRVDSTIQCLIKLGLLTPEMIVEHNAAIEEERITQEKRRYARSLDEVLDDAGLKASKDQQKYIDTWRKLG